MASTISQGLLLTIPLAPLAGFDEEGRAVLDEAAVAKRPDWTAGAEPWDPGEAWSGAYPAAATSPAD